MGDDLINKEKNDVVVQHNDLITARYDLDIDGFRALTLMLSKADQRLENPGWIEITTHEFQCMFDINKKNVWRSMIKATKSLSKSQITFHEINGKRESFTVMNWLSKCNYEKVNGKYTAIRAKLNPELDEFLFNIKRNFSWCFLNAIRKVKTLMSFRIYMYILSHKSHPRCKRDGFFEVDITIDDFRTLFPDSSKRFVDLKRKTIEPAVHDINENTDISVHFEPIRQGRMVTGLRFGCVEEKATIQKPIAPRMPRRPHVKAGSHVEGEWMKRTTEVIFDYEQALLAYDDKLQLPIHMLRRAVQYSKLFKPTWHREKVAELQMREKK